MERSAATTGTSWEGLPALDREGAHLGTCVRSFSDSGVGTTVTEWVVVDVDDRGPSVLPGHDATEHKGKLKLAVERDAVMNAPRIGDVSDLTDEAIAALAYHYGLSGEKQSTKGQDADAAAGDDAPTSGTSASGNTSGAGAALVPLAGVAGVAAAVAAGLGMLQRRAQQRRRPRQRAARAAAGVQRRATSAAGRGSKHLSSAGTALTPALRDAGTRGRKATGTVTAIPRAVAKKGRKTKRSASRTLWKLEVLSAGAAGYVAGARAGHERYEQIMQRAGQLRSGSGQQR